MSLSADWVSPAAYEWTATSSGRPSKPCCRATVSQFHRQTYPNDLGTGCLSREKTLQKMSRSLVQVLKRHACATLALAESKYAAIAVFIGQSSCKSWGEHLSSLARLSSFSLASMLTPLGRCHMPGCGCGPASIAWPILVSQGGRHTTR